MKGTLTFSVDPLTQNIQVEAHLTEMTEFDLLRISTALTEQAFKLQMSLIAKKVKEAESRQIIQEAVDFKRKMDGS